MVDRVAQYLDLGKKIHSVSWWTGVVGALVLLANQVFGLKLDAAPFVSLCGLLATFVFAGHYSASNIMSETVNLLPYLKEIETELQNAAKVSPMESAAK